MGDECVCGGRSTSNVQHIYLFWLCCNWNCSEVHWLVLNCVSLHQGCTSFDCAEVPPKQANPPFPLTKGHSTVLAYTVLYCSWKIAKGTLDPLNQQYKLSEANYPWFICVFTEQYVEGESTSGKQGFFKPLDANRELERLRYFTLSF